LADPAPVLHTAMVHPYFVMRFRLDGVVTVVDAINGAATLDAHTEALKQVAVADRIVLTKSDLINTPQQREALAALRTRLATLNPAAPVIEAATASVPQLIDCGLYDSARKIPDVRRWLAAEAYAPSHDHHHHDVNRHDERIRAFTLASDKAISSSAFEMFLDLVRSMHGPNLLRVKGIVKITEAPDQPVVIHGVQHVFHPPVTLPAWPDADHRTRLVFIVNGIEERAIEGLFNAFLGIAKVDQPDRAALADNPLVPFGGADHLR
jgi:G3E family GTPase